MSDHEQRPRPPSPGRAQNVKPRPDGGKGGRLSLRGVRRSLSLGSERGVPHRRTRERHEEGRSRRRSDTEARRRRAAAAAGPPRGHRKAAAQQERREPAAQQERREPPARHDDGDVADTECVVCFCSYDNVFKTPKLLACGHTFCLECLARINVSSEVLTSLTCPVCRETTRLPHGSDLPQLGNNLDVFRRLPPNMQKALSVRFKRSKGKLFLRKAAGPSVTLPRKKRPDGEASSARGPPPSLFELEGATPAATMIDVGQPPSRVRSRLRQMFRSDRCYNAVMASIVTVTVALMLLGVLAFVIVPSIVGRPDTAPSQNQTGTTAAGGPGPGF
ncbi:E3 ubiquitin-protein ligase RNF183 [Gadus morhua]|uniref:E3 ubiquitin-protein ligase RNF183 n=1 Tax=Gadus morhua TaxID=8049 RepID=UPI0011B54FFA|nr:RING finger protein 225-like [Gadus morhua]